MKNQPQLTVNQSLLNLNNKKALIQQNNILYKQIISLQHQINLFLSKTSQKQQKSKQITSQLQLIYGQQLSQQQKQIKKLKQKVFYLKSSNAKLNLQYLKKQQDQLSIIKRQRDNLVDEKNILINSITNKKEVLNKNVGLEKHKNKLDGQYNMTKKYNRQTMAQIVQLQRQIRKYHLINEKIKQSKKNNNKSIIHNNNNINNNINNIKTTPHIHPLTQQHPSCNINNQLQLQTLTTNIYQIQKQIEQLQNKWKPQIQSLDNEYFLLKSEEKNKKQKINKLEKQINVFYKNRTYGLRQQDKIKQDKERIKKVGVTLKIIDKLNDKDNQKINHIINNKKQDKDQTQKIRKKSLVLNFDQKKIETNQINSDKQQGHKFKSTRSDSSIKKQQKLNKSHQQTKILNKVTSISQNDSKTQKQIKFLTRQYAKIKNKQKEHITQPKKQIAIKKTQKQIVIQKQKQQQRMIKINLIKNKQIKINQQNKIKKINQKNQILQKQSSNISIPIQKKKQQIIKAKPVQKFSEFKSIPLITESYLKKYDKNHQPPIMQSQYSLNQKKTPKKPTKQNQQFVKIKPLQIIQQFNQLKLEYIIENIDIKIQKQKQITTTKKQQRKQFLQNSSLNQLYIQQSTPIFQIKLQNRFQQKSNTQFDNQFKPYLIKRKCQNQNISNIQTKTRSIGVEFNSSLYES